ncbi:MAG: hypothetical protein ABW185_01435 [Sedimenticola sp.]
MQDTVMMQRIACSGTKSVKAKYHRGCWKKYQKASRGYTLVSTKNETVAAVANNDKEQNSFNQLVLGIDEDVFRLGNVTDMSTLLNTYKTLLTENGFDGSSYRTDKLKARLIKHYGTKLGFQTRQDVTKPALVYDNGISKGDAVLAALRYKSALDIELTDTSFGDSSEHDDIPDDKTVLYHAAQSLRSHLMKCNGLENGNCTENDIDLEHASCMTSDKVYAFLWWIFDTDAPLDFGDGKLKCQNASLHTYILSVAQDLLHITSRGCKKTSKHIGLATAVRHMTGSKTLVQMLHRFGHCCSYDELERFDTDIAQRQIDIAERDGVTVPSNICAGSFVQAAADNDDIIEETLDGKHTTHSTSVVLYQRESVLESVRSGTMPLQTRPFRSRSRTVQTLPSTQAILNFSNVGKRPSPQSLLGNVSAEWYQDCSTCETESAHALDKAWILCRICPTKLFEVELENPEQAVPGWSPYNAAASSHAPKLTVIGYCPMLPASPTEFSTVYTVMVTVQRMMTKLNQKTSVITFDEAIYSIAKQIQWRNPDEFKDTVIRLGGFHMAMVFLAIIGKRFANSGLDDLLHESNIYGANTVSNILKGKMYNRCIRAHKLVREAMERLHWRAFSEWCKEEGVDSTFNDDQIITLLNTCKTSFVEGDKSTSRECIKELSEHLGDVLHMTDDFNDHGVNQSGTFEFWTSYLDMTSTLLQFIRAERDGMWTLHLSAVAQMIPYMFAYDRNKYSRWASVYLADMNMLESTAPQVYREFQAGNHPVKRSLQKFNQVWTDLALEQSVNKDSKTKGGIVGFSLNKEAVIRWFLTAHARISITSAVKSMCNLDVSTEEMKHKEATPQRVKRDENDVCAIIRTVEERMIDPFTGTNSTSDDPAPLLNIATGVIAPEDVKRDLRNAKEIGTQAMNTFVSERLNTEHIGFFETLPNLKLKTFSSLCQKAVVKTGNDKKMSLDTDRDLFSRLIVVSKTRDVDLQGLFQYELSAVPLSLAKPDGSLNKSTKSTLLHELEKEVCVSGKLTNQDGSTCWLVDGMAVLQMVKFGTANTFGELADILLGVTLKPIVARTATRIDIVFDRYDHVDSIKAFERARRQHPNAIRVIIKGPQFPLPKQWDKFIGDPANKAEFASFLSTRWAETAGKQLQEGHQLVVAGGFVDGERVCRITRDGTEEMTDMFSTQEEADTRLLLHANHASENGFSRIVVWSPDTDVAVLLLRFTQQLTEGDAKEIWFHTGTKDKSRFIPIHSMAGSLGPHMCQLLPVVHALTGCDSTSALARRGKIKPLKIAEANRDRYPELAQVGTEIDMNQKTVQCVEAYVASLYSADGIQNDDIDKLRYQLFCRKRSVNEQLPPTKDALQQHTMRVNFQTFIWCNAMIHKPQIGSPVDRGWFKENGILKPKLTTQPPAPQSLLELTVCRCAKSKCVGRCGCSNQGLPCCEACTCQSDDSCKNPHKQECLIAEDIDDDETDNS